MGQHTRQFDPESGWFFICKVDPYDPALFHIWARHRCTRGDAISCWHQGRRIWNQTHSRWESYSESHGLYWFELRDGAIMVITCFAMEGE